MSTRPTHKEIIDRLEAVEALPGIDWSRIENEENEESDDIWLRVGPVLLFDEQPPTAEDHPEWIASALQQRSESRILAQFISHAVADMRTLITENEQLAAQVTHTTTEK